MQLNQRTVASSLRVALCTLAVLAFLPQLQAANATGTWSWTTPARQGGEARKTTLTLKAEGEKLTGKISMPGRQGAEPRETEITDGKVKGNDISFTVKREWNNNTFVIKYNGKLDGDVIKGKTEADRSGEVMTRDWEAKREPAKQ
jgi:hypothetical protein